MRVYIFRIHPLWRLFWAVILAWVGLTCVLTFHPVMVILGFMLQGAGLYIVVSLLRLVLAYRETWRL